MKRKTSEASCGPGEILSSNHLFPKFHIIFQDKHIGNISILNLPNMAHMGTYFCQKWKFHIAELLSLHSPFSALLTSRRERFSRGLMWTAEKWATLLWNISIKDAGFWTACRTYSDCKIPEISLTHHVSTLYNQQEHRATPPIHRRSIDKLTCRLLLWHLCQMISLSSIYFDHNER